MTPQVHKLAAHPYGCRVIQRILEASNDDVAHKDRLPYNYE